MGPIWMTRSMADLRSLHGRDGAGAPGGLPQAEPGAGNAGRSPAGAALKKYTRFIGQRGNCAMLKFGRRGLIVDPVDNR